MENTLQFGCLPLATAHNEIITGFRGINRESAGSSKQSSERNTGKTNRDRIMLAPEDATNTRLKRGLHREELKPRQRRKSCGDDPGGSSAPLSQIVVATRTLVVDLLICRVAKHLSFAGSVQCTHGTEPRTAEESTISTDPCGRKLRRNRIASYTLVSVRRVLESCDRCPFKMAMVASTYTGWSSLLDDLALRHAASCGRKACEHLDTPARAWCCGRDDWPTVQGGVRPGDAHGRADWQKDAFQRPCESAACLFHPLPCHSVMATMATLAARTSGWLLERA